MKKIFFICLVVILLGVTFVSAANYDQTVTNRLKGKLLLAVEDKGRVWYVNPMDLKKYEVTFGNALPLFEKLALGILNKDLEQISEVKSTVLGNRLKGRLLLQVQDKGRVWYIDTNGLKHEVTWGNLMDLFRRLSLGISNANLNKIETKSLEYAQQYSVVLKDNASDVRATDVYIKNLLNNKEVFYTTLIDIRKNTYNAEYHNGNIYIVYRIGFDGYPDNDWTDELWRFNRNKQGQKLFSVQGLDFRVSDDEQRIAILKNNKELNLLDNQANIIKTFTASELVFDKERQFLSFFAWGKDSIWIFDGTYNQFVTKINTNSYVINKYDLSELSPGREFIINTNKEVVVFSDYPVMFDVDSRVAFENKKTLVHLILYNLNTKSKTTIATSIAKMFQPKWIDYNNIEYNDPNGTGRIKKKIF